MPPVRIANIEGLIAMAGEGVDDANQVHLPGWVISALGGATVVIWSGQF
jgi:hypothetical protein